MPNPQGTPIRTSTTHTDPITGDVTTTITNSQGNPTRTFTTHSGSSFRGRHADERLNPQGTPIRTVIDHINPVTGDTTRTTLDPQGNPITTENWHTDPVSGDTNHTILNPQGSPIRTEINHTDPVSGNTTKTILNPQGQPIGTETHHTDPVTGDTTRAIFNPQGSPIETELVHKDPITGDTTQTILNEQGQPTRTEVWHEDPEHGRRSPTPAYNPAGSADQHGDLSHRSDLGRHRASPVFNEQGNIESTYTVHKDPITGLWVPDTAPSADSAMADGAAAAEAGLGGVNVGGGLASGGQVAGPGPAVQRSVPPRPKPGVGRGLDPAAPQVVPPAPAAPADQAPPRPTPGKHLTASERASRTSPGKTKGLKGTFSDDPADKPAKEPSQEPAAPAPNAVLDNLTSPGSTTVPADKAFETMHEVIPGVGSDGSVGPLTLKDPKFENGGVTVETPLGPATAKFGVDDKGHLTANITDLPKDPFDTGIMPTNDEATAGMKTALDDFNRQLDAKDVKLTDVKTEGGNLILTKVPISGPAPAP